MDTLLERSEYPVVVDFWAPWCGPCRSFSPIIEKVAGDTTDHAVVAKVNIDEVPELAKRYGITSIPTLLYFSNGKEQNRSVGISQAAVIKKEIEALQVVSA